LPEGAAAQSLFTSSLVLEVSSKSTHCQFANSAIPLP